MRALRSYAILQLIACVASAQSMEVVLRRGLAAVQREDCASGVLDLRAALRHNPNIVPALNAIAVCEAKAGHPDNAAAEFAHIARLQPGAWQAWNNLGASYLSAGQPALAAEALTKATRLAPASANSRFQLGSALLQLNRNRQAFSAFDSAQKLAPADSQITKAWLDAAAALGAEAADCVEKRQYREAISILKLIARPLENSASWNNLLGYAQFKLDETQPALQHLQRALALEPENEDYLLDLGEFLGIHRAREQAVELFEVAVKRMPQSRRARFGLAVSYILMERRDAASRILESLIATDSRFEPAYRALGECYEDAGNGEAMIELGKKLLAVNPNNPEGWYLTGAGGLRQAGVGSEALDGSVQALFHAVALDSASSRAHFTLAKAYEQQGNYEAATRELKETIRLEPEHERAHYVLGRLYRKLDQPQLAAKELEIHGKLKATDRAAQYQALLISSHAP